MQSSFKVTPETLLRTRFLKHRAKKFLKTNESSMKAYIPVSFSNFLLTYPLIFRIFFRVSHAGDVGSTRESLPQGRIAHKNDANFPSIVVIAKCRVRRLLISG